jgi:hypothetical protein
MKGFNSFNTLKYLPNEKKEITTYTFTRIQKNRYKILEKQRKAMSALRIVRQWMQQPYGYLYEATRILGDEWVRNRKEEEEYELRQAVRLDL